jgi:hypothetical protein
MNSLTISPTPMIRRRKENSEAHPSLQRAADTIDGSDSFSNILDSPDMLSDAIVSPPPSNTMRWKNKSTGEQSLGTKDTKQHPLGQFLRLKGPLQVTVDAKFAIR